MKKEFESEDPMEIIGVELPHQSKEQLHDMALCFAEEFIRDGWDQEKIFQMFKTPFYQGPHLVWKQKGDDFVKSVIQEALQIWRPERIPPPAADPSGHAL